MTKFQSLVSWLREFLLDLVFYLGELLIDVVFLIMFFCSAYLLAFAFWRVAMSGAAS